ncbi:DUF952 domain-containing protein [Couchioplanes caeruleus]|uniref:DUF952 domain-containing protein n=2 Tax=Couchioplanes caeruleus TaxID=56438 RepID=A0A1K0FEN2_9ACTN|nr:DUF952 domain-containing protein [Couchioplanes caeruleus]OJF11289.1 hypothetical protein BG844_27210 [Couchioplanes caeruleus subsp. caeruleus]ROP27987.1 uncharacterized protein (DUF952 family) [Couchioplanes caeruleus]
MLVYKILLSGEWSRFQASGSFDGSPFDRSSGYIHLSTREQVAGTAERRFADEGALVLLGVEADAFGDKLRWEMMPNGGPYPHLYDCLTLDDVVAVHHAPDAAAVEETLSQAKPPA